MEYLIICIATFFIAILNLLTGFGLGTVLLPVFTIFFPLTLAIAAMSIVHLLTSLYETCLVGKYANRKIVVKFGIPALFAALIGAYLLSLFSNFKPLFSYKFHALDFNITIIGLIVGMMIFFSSLFVLMPKLKAFSVPTKYIPIGGLLSGLFGGLTGYQGAIRSAFLIKSELNKEQFIGTSVICSIIVDLARLLIYGFFLYRGQFGELQKISLLLTAVCLVAFVGVYISSKLMLKVTYKSIQILVGSMLFLLGFAIILGIGKK